MLRTEVWLALRPEEFHLGSLPLPPPHPPPPHLRSLSPPETYQSAVWHIYPGPTLQNIHLFQRLGLSTIYSGASDIHTNALDALVFR